MSLFEKIFGTNKSKVVGQQFELLNNTFGAVFTSFNGKIYDSPEIRSCVDAIARNVAKQSPKHIRTKGEKYESLKDDEITRIVSQQPNELMNAYDFYYALVSELELNNNAFAYIQRDENGKLTGLYPIRAGMYELVEYRGNVYIQFQFGSGKTYTASVRDDVIHLKRFFCENDVLGGSNQPIKKVMALKNVINEGIENAIKTTQGVKGILKTEKTMLRPEDIKATRDKFVADFISNNDGSGIAGLDATTSFTPVSITPQTASDGQINAVSTEVMNYFGVNQAIISSKYNEEEWIAFYESVVEPIVDMLSMEMTNKIFTLDERRRGNKIVFEENRMNYVSSQRKISVAKELQNYLSINEVRKMFGFDPVDDPMGDKILQSLNYVNSDIADIYQLKTTGIKPTIVTTEETQKIEEEDTKEVEDVK